MKGEGILVSVWLSGRYCKVDSKFRMGFRNSSTFNGGRCYDHNGGNLYGSNFVDMAGVA